jgi:hypothetical protein
VLSQGAAISCYAGPLIALLHGTSPTQQQLQEITASVTQDASLLTPWELINSLWGLAMFGADLNQQQMEALAAAAAGQMQHMTVYQAIVATWALLLLCSSMQQLCSSSWLQLLSRLQDSGLQEYDEAAVMYLLHAAMQRAALQDSTTGGLACCAKISNTTLLVNVVTALDGVFCMPRVVAGASRTVVGDAMVPAAGCISATSASVASGRCLTHMCCIYMCYSHMCFSHMCCAPMCCLHMCCLQAQCPGPVSGK